MSFLSSISKKIQGTLIQSEQSRGVLSDLPIVHKLLKENHSKGRSQCLRTQAKLVLEQGKKWNITCDWGQFRLVNAGSYIRQTEFEGGTVYRNIEFWKKYLSLWKSGKGLFFTTSLSKDHIDAILSVLNDMQDLIIPTDRVFVSGGEELKSAALFYQNKLNKYLKEKKCLYIPLGYRGGVGREGHAIAFKLQLVGNEKIVVSALNVGEGSRNHPVLNYTPTQEKLSYSFYPIEIEKNVFFGEAGLAALCHLIRYETDPQNPNYTPYSGEDLYEIFLELGSINPKYLGSKLEALEKKSQRSGTCSSKADEMVVRDILAGRGVSALEVKKISLNLSFCSLVTAYCDYQVSPTSPNRYFLRKAAEKFGVHLKKRQTILTDSEYFSGIAVQHEILKTTKIILECAVADEVKKQENATDSFYFPKVEPTREKIDPFQKADSNSLEKLFYLPEFNVEKILTTLDRWMKTLRILPENKVFSFFSQCTRVLPIPEWGKEDLWDQIPIEEISSVVDKLQKLTYLGLKMSETSGSDQKKMFFDQILAIHTVFVIADKLARKSPNSMLQEFASPFIPLLYKQRMEPNDFASIPLGEDNHRFALVSHYFSKSAKAANYRIIFPIDPTIRVELNNLGRFANSHQGIYHIDFLKRHINRLYPEAATAKFLPICLHVWENSDKYLPSEVNALYYFAFLSAVAFFGESYSSFPEKLIFEKTIDESGLRAIKIGLNKTKSFLKNHPSSEDKGVNKEKILEQRFAFNQVFLNIFDVEVRKLTTNDSVCLHLKEKDADLLRISEPVFRNLLRITRNDTLKPMLAEAWISKNYYYLEHPGIRMLINHCFFGGSGLYDWLKEESQTCIGRLRKCVSDGLQFFSNSSKHLEILLFLIRTGIFFETHYLQICPDISSEIYLESYIDTLSKLKSHPVSKEQLIQIEHDILLANLYRKNRSEKETISLLKNLLRFFSKNSYLGEAWLKAEDCARIFGNELEGRFKNKAFAQNACHEIIKEILPEKCLQADEKWEGNFPHLKSQEITLNFASLTVEAEEGVLGKNIRPEMVENHSFYLHLIEKYGAKYLKNNSDLTSIDGELRIRNTEESTVIEMQIMFRGEKRWGRCVNYRVGIIDPLNLDFLNHSSYLPHVHFQLIDAKDGDPSVVTYNFSTGKSELQIELTHEGTVISRLDDNGYPTATRLANLVGHKDHHLSNKILRYAPAGHVLCFIDSKNKQVESLNFFCLGLEFKQVSKKSGFGRLESVQFPGYFLDLNAFQLEELNGFEGAFVLENEEGNRKILLPTVELEEEIQEFSTRAKQKKAYFLYDQMGYFELELDPLEGVLRSSVLEANIYIAYILKLQGDEFKALKYLKKIEPIDFFTLDQIERLSRFTYLKDHSPTSLGFNMQLFYFICQNMNLMVEQRFTDQRYQNRYFNLIDWGVKTYCDYLKFRGQDRLSVVPKELRLNLAEEQAILRTVQSYWRSKNKDQKKKMKLPKILDLRYQLLCTNKEKVSFEIEGKEIRSTSRIYKQLYRPEQLGYLKLDSENSFPYGKKCVQKGSYGADFSFCDFPIRISPEAVEAKFIMLYNQAIRCQKNVPDPFDFVLLACLKTQGSFSVSRLVSLLFYVRHFPEKFKDLMIQEEAPDVEKIRVFNQIVKRVKNLKETQEYENFLSRRRKRILFDYHKEITLFPPKHKNVPESIKIKNFIDLDSEPFAAFRNCLFQRNEVPLLFPEKPAFLNFPPRQLEALEDEILEKYTRGYRELHSRTRTEFIFDPQGLEKVQRALKKQKDTIHKDLVQRRAQIIQKTNSPHKTWKKGLERDLLLKEMDYRLAQNSQQLLPILPETIMKEVILRGNAQFLKENSPLLSSKEIEESIADVCFYYHLNVIYQLCQEAERCVSQLIRDPNNPVVQSELFQILDYKFGYDPAQYPEISYFKVKNGKLPREGQVEIYQWICEGLLKGENRLFQHKAGGGKTDYLAPLVMLKAKMMGYMPLFLSTVAIYTIDRDNLNFTMKTLDEQLGLLEIGLHTKLSAEDAQFIYEQLEHFYALNKGMIITPLTYYSLYLQHLHAGQEKKAKNVYWLGKILAFLKTKCLLLGDESHRNGDPMTRSIFGVGDCSYLPKEENLLLLELMKPLLGFEIIRCPMTQKPIHEIARLGKNRIGIPSQQEISLIQQTLAVYIANYSDLKIPDECKREFIHYWTDKKAAQPQYLQKLERSEHKRAGLIALAGYFILDLLPEIVRLRTELDHTPSIYEEQEFETPCHHRIPSTAEYEDTYLAASLTIKGAAHRGLTTPQLRRLLERLVEKYFKEKMETQSVDTDTSDLFTTWTKNTPLNNLHLNDITISDVTQMQNLAAHLAHSPQVINFYLLNFILPQIGYALEQLSATPAHLVNGVKRAVLFSATPLSKEIYPRTIDQMRYEAAFEAEVAHVFCEEKNQNKVFVQDPGSFFEDVLSEKNISHFKQALVFIDPAGFFSDYSNFEVALHWLEKASHLDGVLYFKEERSLKMSPDSKICLLLRNRKIIELDGSRIKESLAAKGYDWEKLSIGTYYDASHCESANILQKKGARAFVFIADKLTISRLTQALLRMRGYLNPKLEQNSTWVIPEGLLNKIPLSSSGNLDGAAIFSWTVTNEVEQLKKKVILAAFQEISFEIDKKARDEIERLLEDPEGQILLMEKYKNGLLDHIVHNPYAVFADHEKEEKCRVVLMNYAKDRYQKYGYKVPFKNNTVLLSRIESIVQEAESRVKMILTGQKPDLGLEVERHTQQKKETEQKQYKPRPFDPIAGEKLIGKLRVTFPRYPDLLDIRSARSFFDTPRLTERLFLDINQRRTAVQSGSSLGKKYLKPIDFFMILFEEGQEPIAVVQSNDFLPVIQEDMALGTEEKEVKHKVLLVTSEGVLIQRGKKRLEPTEKEISDVMNSQWLQDLVIDAALLKGKIAHPERLRARIADWKDFPKFWEKIIAAQPNPEAADRLGMNRLLNDCQLNG